MVSIAADKEEAIFTAATEVFARLGFKKASIDQIAAQANVGKGTVYLVAESKEDLYYRVLHREVRAWTAECARVIDPRKPADQLLVELLAASVRYGDARPLVRELIFGQTKAVMPAWTERLRELRVIAHGNVSEILQLGVRQGVFRSDLDVPVIAGLLQDWNVAAYILEGLSVAPADFGVRARVGLDLVLNGLKAR